MNSVFQLIDNLFSFIQLLILINSVFIFFSNLFAYCICDIVILVSSASNLICAFVESGKSFIYVLNKRGPRVDH